MAFTFNSVSGQTWTLNLTIGVIRQIDQADVSNLTSVKLTMLKPNEELVRELMSNKALMSFVIYLACASQVDQKLGLNNPTEDDRQQAFLNEIDSAAFIAAQTAFMDAYLDFYPDLRIGLSTYQALMAEGREIAEQELLKVKSSVTAKLKSTIQKAIQTEIQNIPEMT